MKKIFSIGEPKEQEKINKALFLAAQNGEVDNVRNYLDQGAEVDFQYKNETPILIAATGKHSEVVRILLDFGANVEIKNKKGKTAVDIATFNNDIKTKYILSSRLGDKRVFDLLESMGLLEHWEKFVREEVKLEDLQGYTEKDLEEMGIPKGPRGRLLSHFAGQPVAAPALSQGDLTSALNGGAASNAIHRGLGRASTNGNSRSMTELPVPGGRTTLVSKRPLAMPPDNRERRPIGGSYRTAKPEQDHYGQMPKINGAQSRSYPNLEHHYVSTPNFVPEHPTPQNNNRNNNNHDDGHYASTPNLGGDTQYATVDDVEAVDDSIGGDNYATPPDLSLSSDDDEKASLKHSDNEFDSSSYREIKYSELILEEEIGRGAFGSVYKGTWRGAPVAIKKLHSFSISDAHMVAEFRREASMMQLVGNHPNIVKFVGACSKEEPYCLVSLFCSNGSLESFLKKEKLTAVLEAKVLMEIAAGVLHLHCEGVIHRDLAARNVLVGDNYQVYITDFGFARIKEAGNAFNTTKSTIGPVKYMAPESLRDKKYSEKTDAFSFGVLLWEILHPGKVPYEGEDLLKIAMAVINERKRLSIPPSCNPSYKQLMQDCWEENPDKRPNFQEIYKRLYENYKDLSASSGGPQGAKPPTTPPTTPNNLGGGTRPLGGNVAPPRGGIAPRGGFAKPQPPNRPKPGPGAVALPEVKPKPQPVQPPPKPQPLQQPKPQPKPQPVEQQPPPQQPQQDQQGGYTATPFPAPAVNPNATNTQPSYNIYNQHSYSTVSPPPQTPQTPPVPQPQHTPPPQPNYAPTNFPAPYSPPYTPTEYTSYVPPPQPPQPTYADYTSFTPPPHQPAYPSYPTGGYTSYQHPQPPPAYPPQPQPPYNPGYAAYPPPADPYYGHGYSSYAYPQ